MQKKIFLILFVLLPAIILTGLPVSEAQTNKTAQPIKTNVTGGVWNWKDVEKYEQYNDFPSNQTPWKKGEKSNQRKELKDFISKIRSQTTSIKAFPSAADFPGIPEDETPIIEKKITIDTRFNGWHSTGMYALPGIPVEIYFSRKNKPDGLSIRIGCHTDSLDLEKHGSWQRNPDLSYTKGVSGNRTSMTSPSGGLIYIICGNSNEKRPFFEVTISNAVEAPLYIMGKTTKEEWAEQMERCKAPWGEIACPRLIVTLTLSQLQKIQDIEHTAQILQDSLAAQDWLAGWDITSVGNLKHPMRFVVDRQISAGSGHSGYPAMGGGLGWGDRIVSGLTTGHWGLWHETGHNHQNPPWRMDAMGEITVNLFTLVSHCLVLDQSTGGIPDAISKVFKEKKTFHDYNGDSSVQLSFFMEMIKGIGFEPFREASISYANKPYPGSTTNDGKWEWLMIHLSEASGRNLAPYFKAWGFKIGSAAESRTGKYPIWLPHPNFPKNYSETSTGTSTYKQLDEYGNPIEENQN